MTDIDTTEVKWMNENIHWYLPMILRRWKLSSIEINKDTIAEAFDEFFKVYLQDVQTPLIDIDNSDPNEDNEIEFMERAITGNTVMQWIDQFAIYLSKGWHKACLWIINQGYISVALSLLKNDCAEFIDSRVEKLTDVHHKRIKEYLDLEEKEPHEVGYWIGIANSEERLVSEFIIDTIIEGIFLSLEHPDKLKDFQSLRTAFWKEYKPKKR